MIAWPDERRIPEQARRGLKLFRESGAAQELAQARRHFRLVAWPWSDALPVRIVLADDQGDLLVFECEEGGLWRIEDGFVEPHPPSAAALRRDAAALQPT